MNKTTLIKTALLSATFVLAGAFTSMRADEAADFDVRPVPIKTPPPAYPSNLKDSGVTGLVSVKVQIDENGDVVECVVSKSTHSGFEQAALDAIRSWKFKPASKAGAAVKSRMIVPIKFNAEA